MANVIYEKDTSETCFTVEPADRSKVGKRRHLKNRLIGERMRNQSILAQDGAEVHVNAALVQGHLRLHRRLHRKLDLGFALP